MRKKQIIKPAESGKKTVFNLPAPFYKVNYKIIIIASLSYGN